MKGADGKLRVVFSRSSFPSVDDNRSLAGWIIKDLSASAGRGKGDVLNYGGGTASRDDAMRRHPEATRRHSRWR